MRRVKIPKECSKWWRNETVKFNNYGGGFDPIKIDAWQKIYDALQEEKIRLWKKYQKTNTNI